MLKNSILAFGGNADSPVGTPRETLNFALKSLEGHDIFPLKVSRPYVNPAYPRGSSPDFVNAVAVIQSRLDPVSLLHVLHEIEAEYGRVREKRWGPRTLDIDLIACGDIVQPDIKGYQAWRDMSPEDQQCKSPSELILPHPRIQDRAFVLVPMAEVAPEWIHPVSGLSVVQMLDNLSEIDRNEVVPL